MSSGMRFPNSLTGRGSQYSTHPLTHPLAHPLAHPLLQPKDTLFHTPSLTPAGVVSTFVKILLPHTSHTACDINPAAVQATLETAQLNNKEISAVESDLGKDTATLQNFTTNALVNDSRRFNFTVYSFDDLEKIWW